MICAGKSLKLKFEYAHVEILIGSLVELTSGLPNQPLTSHPSVKGQLESSAYDTTICGEECINHLSEFAYREVPVIVSNNLITR